MRYKSIFLLLFFASKILNENRNMTLVYQKQLMNITNSTFKNILRSLKEISRVGGMLEKLVRYSFNFYRVIFETRGWALSWRRIGLFRLTNFLVLQLGPPTAHNAVVCRMESIFRHMSQCDQEMGRFCYAKEV
uniref:Secreted protein n=1 Tax=Heterorhabditis bacteriophora TaxID=37862 RepID=A0A1I7W960_HETBA